MFDVSVDIYPIATRRNKSLPWLKNRFNLIIIHEYTIMGILNIG